MLYIISANPRDLQAASAVGRSVTLQEIVTVKLNIVNSAPYLDTPAAQCRVTWKHRIDGYRVVRGNQLIVDIGLKLTLVTESDDDATAAENNDKEGPKKNVAEIDVVFANRYALPNAPMPDFIREHGLPAFAKFNALYNVWPYLRAEVQRLTASMGFTSITLPLLRIEPRQEQENGRQVAIEEEN